jgi:AcrR family transcriptional regulator
MTTRSYHSPARLAAARQTRERIVAIAIDQLREASSVTLESVAKAAGVTRLTVYNQFGSRHALFEAVFEALAARGGLHRIAEVMAGTDASAGIGRLVGIFCEFWDSDRRTFVGLHDVAATVPDFAASLQARHARRRQLFSVMVGRLVGQGEVAPGNAEDLVDLLSVLTSLPVFAQLTAGGRSGAAACSLLQAQAGDAVRRASHGSAAAPTLDR